MQGKLAASRLIQVITPGSAWFHRWIYYLAAGFMATAVALRALLIFNHSPLLGVIMLLLAAWVLAFTANIPLPPQLNRLAILPIGLQLLITLALLLTTRTDFYGFLFAITGMQAVQHITPRAAVALIGLTALLTFAALAGPNGILHALSLSLAFSGISAFLGFYIHTARRARQIEQEQQALAKELGEANRRLESYAQQRQQLAAGRERQRLSRELHDSVTQTVFSLNLASQSALLLLERDPLRLAANLDRLEQLARNALAEMQVLVTSLALEKSPGFLAALQLHLADRLRLDNLTVSLEVEGSQPLNPAEEAGLFRIAQEALNNAVKHAGVSQAALRLHLAEPFWMEINDQGAGFDPQQPILNGQVGLTGLRERAAEIGWTMQIISAPGAGTCVRVERPLSQERQA